VTARNASDVSNEPAVPLTEVADLSEPEQRRAPMPELKFQYGGDAKKMRTFIVEPGAVTPPEVIAAQTPPPPTTTAPAPQSQTQPQPAPQPPPAPQQQ
jgi:hypothetical protein